MEKTKLRTYRKQYKKKEPRGTLSITDRDIHWFQKLRDNHYMSSFQFALCIGETYNEGIQRRLKRLHHHNYIDRPTGQKEFANGPLIYILSDRAIEILEKQYFLDCTEARAILANSRQNKPAFYKHAVETAEALIRIERAGIEQATSRFITQNELLALGPASTTLRDGNPLAITTTIDWFGSAASATAVPDGLFALRFDPAPKNHETLPYFLELDMGTMPVVRRNFRQSSILKKMLVYAEATLNGRVKDLFVFPHAKVVFVTTSWDRVTTMQKCYYDFLRDKIAPGVFLFTTMDELKKDPFSPHQTRIETANRRPYVFDPNLMHLSSTKGQLRG